jgi:ABC-2 type transport system permease protein
MSAQAVAGADAPAPAGWTSITRRMIGDRRKSLFWWTFGVTVLVVIMAATYPSIRDTGDALDEYVASLPEGLRQAFGLEGASIASPEGYLTSQLYSNLYPIVILIMALGLTAWSIAGSENDGSLETVLANPVSRVRVALARGVGAATMVAVVTAVSTGALVLLAPLFGLDEGVPWWGYWSAGLQTFAFVAVCASLTFAVGAASGSKGLAIAVGAGVAVGGFLLNALGAITDVMETLRWASPWYWFLKENPVVTEPNLLNTGLPLALSVLVVAAGIPVFARRDLRGG